VLVLCCMTRAEPISMQQSHILVVKRILTIALHARVYEVRRAVQSMNLMYALKSAESNSRPVLWPADVASSSDSLLHIHSHSHMPDTDQVDPYRPSPAAC